MLESPRRWRCSANFCFAYITVVAVLLSAASVISKPSPVVRKASPANAKAPVSPKSPHKPRPKTPTKPRNPSPNRRSPSPKKRFPPSTKPKLSPRRPPSSPKKSPPRGRSPSPKRPPYSPKTIKPESGRVCYPGPYTDCGTASIPKLPKTPSMFPWTNPPTPVLLPPGNYAQLAIAADQSYYLAGSYTITTLIVEGYLQCGPPDGPQVDISMTLVYALVSGFFKCGSPGKPYASQVTITMTGQSASDGTKHFAVTGRLMLVGTPRVGWTSLAATVMPGDTSFTTLKRVDWKQGDMVVVTPTDLVADHCEEMRIVSVTPVDGGGSLVTVEAAFQRPHWGTLQTYPTTNGAVSVLDERAEVGLLERNIVIQGDAASEVDGKGAFVTMYEGGHAWIRDAKFYRVGQKGVLGKYPVHWHILGDRKGDYLRSSVIWKSWNRCMSVHATHNLLVDTVVCYDHIGHGFMIEDSCEVNNMFRRNLGIRTRRPPTIEEAVLDTDFTNLATYWIVNPLNHFVGNVAVASDDSGYWIMLPPTPLHYCLSLNMTPDMNPQRMSLGLFDDNVAHSSVAGLVIELSICNTARAPACGGGYDPPDIPVVNRLRAYKCTHSFRTTWITVVKPLFFDSCVMADNGGSVLLAGQQILSRSLIVGQSANTLTATTPPARMGFGLYDGPAGILNCHFAGFEKPGFRSIQTVSSSTKHWNAFIQGTTFDPLIPAANRFVIKNNISMSEAFNSGLVDVDGSLTGTPNTTLRVPPGGALTPEIGRQDPDFNIPSLTDCSWNAVWGVHLCQGVDWVHVRVHHNLAAPGTAGARIVDVIRSDGKQATMDTGNKDTGFRPWYQFTAILYRKISYTVKYRNAESITWNPTVPATPAPFHLELLRADPGVTVTLTLKNLPAGTWKWYGYDCIGKVVVFSGVSSSGDLLVPLTATGEASGAYPNMRFAAAKVRVCSALPCTC